MWKVVSRWGGVAALAFSVASFIGCSSSKETAGRDTLTANVGQYPPAPSGIAHPRVAVPQFNVTTAGGISNSGDLNDLASDQCSTLLDQTGRFAVIERGQLQKLLNEQGLEGIVRPGELAKQGQVRGIDYLLIGKVTNLRVKKENKSNGFGLAQVGGLVNLGGADVKNKEVDIKTDCGVDLRLVDPSTGELLTSNFSEYSRTDSAKSMGLTILGANAESNADIQLSEDDKGKILRLALDDCIRKMLPKIDSKLRNLPQKSEGSSQAPIQGNTSQTNSGGNSGTQTVAAKKFCPNCGHEVTAGLKFCPNCGAKIE